jgi:hypothetical protein
MTQEQGKHVFAEVTPNQMEVFAGKIEELRPMLGHPKINISETEDFIIGSSELGEHTLTIVDDDTKEEDSREVIGRLTVNNLGGLIELGPGIVVPTDPFRYTTETSTASFLVDDKGVEVSITEDTAQNLRYPADLTVTTQYKAVVTNIEEDEDFEYSREKNYRYIMGEGSGYHEVLRRRPKSKTGEDEAWVSIESGDLAEMINRHKLVQEGSISLEDSRAMEAATREALAEAAKDHSTEYPYRFDQNRFSDIMGILDQIDDTKLDNSAPSPVKQGSFVLVAA